MKREDIKIGMKVRIIDTGESQAATACRYSWPDAMDASLGKIGEVAYINCNRDMISVKLDGLMGTWTYHSDSLEEAVNTPKIKTVSVYKIGQIFDIATHETKYKVMLSYVGADKLAFITLDNGEYWAPSSGVSDPSNISQAELDKCAGSSKYELLFDSHADMMAGIPAVYNSPKCRVNYSIVTTVEDTSTNLYESKEDFEKRNPSLTFISFEG